MASFKEELKREFLSKELSRNQLESLNDLQGEKRSIKKMVIGISTAAFATAAGILIFVVSSLSTSFNEKARIEIAKNHLKNESPKILSSSLDSLSEELVKLDFKLVNSPRLSEYTVIGGKYCSVQGKIAAQIKLKSKNGEYSTLYQFKVESNKKLEESEFESSGVTIDIWKEGEVYLGHAK